MLLMTIIFIHQHIVVGREKKIRTTVTRLWHITNTYHLNYRKYSRTLKLKFVNLLLPQLLVVISVEAANLLANFFKLSLN